MSTEIDFTLLGKTTAEFMDELTDALPQENGPGKVIAVGLIVVIDFEEDTYLKVHASDKLNYQRVGIFQSATDLVRQSFEVEDDNG